MKKSGNLVPPLLRPSNGTQELAKKMKKRGTSSPFARTWWWHQLAPINNKTKRKKRELGLLLCQKLAMEPTCTQKQLNKRKKEKKERKLGLPFYWKLTMEPTYTHKQQNIRKKKKKRELDFLSRLGDGTHPLPEQQNKKKKRGASLSQKLAMVPTKTKTKSKTKSKKKIGCLPLSSCFQTLYSSSSKLSTLQALSSINPNA